MKSFLPPQLTPRPVNPPLVLVADDDARVLELLQIALTQAHFRVVTATDGDEAIRRALAERPDAAVLDVRMPRRNGLEVCEYLRHDPEDPQIPIVLVSASADTDARLDGLARGADDVMAKPFSPRELVARLQRLLARTGEARLGRRRIAELERDLVRAQDEVRRAHGELRQERRLRELGAGAGRELHRSLDLDELCERVLQVARRPLGGGALGLLVPGVDAGEAWTVRNGHGDAPARFADLSLAPAGELAALLSGLGRLVGQHELDRFPEMREALAPFTRAGFSQFLPLRAAQGLVGVLVAEEPSSGESLAGADREALGVLAEHAALALCNARQFRASQDRALTLLAERATSATNAPGDAEAAEAARAAVRTLGLPVREASLVAHAVALGSWGWSEPCRAALEVLERDDPTRRIRALRTLVEAGEALEWPQDAPAELRQAVLVTGACVRYAVGRRSGRSALESATTALAWSGVEFDPDAREALELAFGTFTGELHPLSPHAA